MLRWIILAVAVVGLTAGATLVVQYLPDPETRSRVPVSTRTGPQPKWELDQEPIYQFGTMSQQELGRHTWTIKNVGQGDLELWMEGKPTCSCTIAKLENGQKAVVKPGESTTIDLEWNTKEFEKTYSQGATFGTNDPARPVFVLKVAGEVYPPVIIYPPQMIQFPSISNEETHHARIAVFSVDRPALKLTKLATSKPGLIVAAVAPMVKEELKQLEIKAGHDVTIEIKPGMPQGRFHEELIIQTDHPKRPEVKVTVAGLVTGPITVVPERLRLPGVSSRDGASRDLILLVRGGRETHFEVAYKPEKLEVAIAPDEAAPTKGRYRLTVTVPRGTPAGPIDGEIILKTDHPKASELKIPVNILVSRSAAA
jgi:hypothetical protein